jgi:sigma-B regulation protein RsbU (phosphoserine phosphatase)
MTPATTMAGDFYDFIELPDGRIGLVMADVAGKGVPAAFFMAVSRTNLRELAAHHSDPGACLAHANDLLCTQNPMELFVTVFYGIFDAATGRLEYANGGHNAPILRRNDGSVEALNGAGGRMLGVKPGAAFLNHSVALEHGDRLVLYTDGVTEAFNPSNEPFGEQRLIAEIQAHGDGAASGLVERIFGSVTRFAGAAAQSDDITLAVLVWGAPCGEAAAARLELS